MQVAQLEILSDATNRVIVRSPGRKFAGVLIQGDSLSVLVREALALVAALKKLGGDLDTVGAAESLAFDLGGRLLHYQQVLAEHQIPLPYAEPLRADELPGPSG